MKANGLNPSLSVNLSTGVSPHDYIIIEQEPWPKDVGQTSVTQGILTIGSVIFGGAIPSPNCGGLAGFTAPVYVYPSRSSLPFKFDVSHGDFLYGTTKVLLREEIIQCSFELSSELSYPVYSMVMMKWKGLCYDKGGNVVGRPSVTQDGRTLVFGSKVHGSIRVLYYVYRVEYRVNISAREDAIENSFDCVAFCVWDGGVEFKEIEAPSGFEETLGNCGNGLYGPQDVPGGTIEICQPEAGESYPKAVRADRNVKINYCDRKLISDKITEVVDKNNDTEPCSDGSITTN